VDSDKDIFVVDLEPAKPAGQYLEPGAVVAASEAPTISSSGRYVAFASSTRLTSSDNNRFTDIYVWDSVVNRPQLVSVGTNAMPADQGSSRPSISADGRYVAFASIATNLVERDFNRKQDVFVRDLQTGRTERVSLTHNGSQSSVVSRKPSISGDGRFVTFLTTDGNIVPGDHNIFRDLFVFDRESGVSRLVSVNIHGQPADDHSGGASLSYDGTEIAFASIAEDLIEGDLNYWEDVFVRVWDGETLAPTTSRESR
jgi:Tol biopolymer transport system component